MFSVRKTTAIRTQLRGARILNYRCPANPKAKAEGLGKASGLEVSPMTSRHAARQERGLSRTSRHHCHYF